LERVSLPKMPYQTDVAGGIRSGRVIEVLAQLVSVHGAPRYLRSDNGPEFVACAILRWLHEAGIETALIDPWKRWQNGAATATRSARIRVSDT
jgi:putative transposase